MAAGETEDKGSPELGKPLLLSATLLGDKGKHGLCNLGGRDVFGCLSFIADKEESKAMRNSEKR